MRQFTSKVIILIILQTTFFSDGYTDESIARLKKIREQVKSEFSHNEGLCSVYLENICTKSNLTELHENRKNISDIIENYLHNNEKLSKAEEKLKEYITTCKKYKDGDLKKFVREFNLPESIGGWPVFDANWKPDKFNWKTSMAELDSYSTSVIIKRRLITEPGTSKNGLFVDVEDFDLIQSDDRKNQLLKLMSILEIENIDEVISDAMQVEDECRKVVSAHKSTDEEHIEETDFAGLKQKIPEIDWDKHMEIITGEKLNDDFIVVIEDVDVLRKVVEKISDLDPKIVANYFFCNFVYQLPSVCEDEQCGQCIVHAIDNFYSVVSGIIKKIYFTENTKVVLSGITKSVVQAFQEESATVNTTENIESSINDKRYQDVEIDSSSILRAIYSLRQNDKRLTIQNLSKENTDSFDMLTHFSTWMHSSSFFMFNNHPMFHAYTTTALEPVREYFRISGFKSLNNSGLECSAEQLSTAGFRDQEILSLIAGKIIATIYYEWLGKHAEILQAEDETLKEYELASNRVYSIQLHRQVCGFEDTATPKRVSSLFCSMDRFLNTFICPSPIDNLLKKCEQ